MDLNQCQDRIDSHPTTSSVESKTKDCGRESAKSVNGTVWNGGLGQQVSNFGGRSILCRSESAKQHHPSHRDDRLVGLVIFPCTIQNRTGHIAHWWHDCQLRSGSITDAFCSTAVSVRELLESRLPRVAHAEKIIVCESRRNLGSPLAVGQGSILQHVCSGARCI
jgi:hypothetical protein